jgi:hypothetical protein
MSENRVQRIFGLKRQGARKGWRRLCNEAFLNMYTSNIIRVITSRQMGWVGHVAHIVGMKNAYNIYLGNLKGRDYLKYLGIGKVPVIKHHAMKTY